MNVYELKAVPDRYEVLVFAHESESKQSLSLLDAKPQAATWTPLEVKVLHDDYHKGRPTSDFPLLVGMTVLNRRAVDALRDLLETSGEILPLRCDKGEYYAYNVTHMVDALDETRSDLKRFKDGGVMHINRYEFQPEKLDASLFKIPQQRGRIYVTDKFVKCVKDAELVGFDFVPVWSYSPTRELTAA